MYVTMPMVTHWSSSPSSLVVSTLLRVIAILSHISSFMLSLSSHPIPFLFYPIFPNSLPTFINSLIICSVSFLNLSVSVPAHSLLFLDVQQNVLNVPKSILLYLSILANCPPFPCIRGSVLHTASLSLMPISSFILKFTHLFTLIIFTMCCRSMPTLPICPAILCILVFFYSI